MCCTTALPPEDFVEVHEAALQLLTICGGKRTLSVVETDGGCQFECFHCRGTWTAKMEAISIVKSYVHHLRHTCVAAASAQAEQEAPGLLLGHNIASNTTTIAPSTFLQHLLGGRAVEARCGLCAALGCECKFVLVGSAIDRVMAVGRGWTLAEEHMAQYHPHNQVRLVVCCLHSHRHLNL